MKFGMFCLYYMFYVSNIPGAELPAAFVFAVAVNAVVVAVAVQMNWFEMFNMHSIFFFFFFYTYIH